MVKIGIEWKKIGALLVLSLISGVTPAKDLEAITTMEANREVRLKWPSKQGAKYLIERSLDLATWDDIGFDYFGQATSDPEDPSNNERFVRRRDLDDYSDPLNPIFASGANAQRFEFLIWDTEISMGQGALTGDLTGSDQDITAMHGLLLDHPDYQQAWQDRVALHFDQPGGVFSIQGGVHAAATRFINEAAKFEAVADCESARWGDVRDGILFTGADAAASNALRAQWIRDRRAIVLSQLRARNLAD